MTALADRERISEQLSASKLARESLIDNVAQSLGREKAVEVIDRVLGLKSDRLREENPGLSL